MTRRGKLPVRAATKRNLKQRKTGGMGMREQMMEIAVEEYFKILGQYESGGPAQRTTTSKRSTVSGDTLLDMAGTTVRERARWLDENHDLAIGVIETLVDNIVGTGIMVEPQVKKKGGELHTEANQMLTQLHRNWARKPEVTWQHDLGSSERIAALHWLRDGEVLGQLITGDDKFIDHGTVVPFSVELIEADFLPLDFNDESKRIRQGIERNAWGRPIAFHFYKAHPYDNHTSANIILSASQLKRVLAANVVFLKNTRRISQLRGVSIFVSVINRLADLKQYEDFERVAAQVAAALTVFISRSIENDCPEWLTQDQKRAPLRQIAPGMMMEGLPGEEPRVIQSNRPSNQIMEYRRSQLRAVSSGTGAGYSTISKDYAGSYSSQRQELVEQNRHYMSMRGQFIGRWSQPIYERFVASAQLKGLLDGFLKDADLLTLYDAGYMGPPMPWVDPLKEMQAIEKELEMRINSRSQIIRERGGLPDEVFKQIDKDEEQSPMPVKEKPGAPGDDEPDPENPDEDGGKKREAKTVVPIRQRRR